MVHLALLARQASRNVRHNTNAAAAAERPVEATAAAGAEEVAFAGDTAAAYVSVAITIYTTSTAVHHTLWDLYLEVSTC